MLLFEGRGIEIENTTFALGVIFLLSTKLLLIFQTQIGFRTGLVVRSDDSRSVLLFLHHKFAADLC